MTNIITEEHLRHMRQSNRPAPQLVPTADQLDAYNLALRLSHQKSGVQYQTGPRFGQQTADQTMSGRHGIHKYMAEQAKIRF